MALRVEPGKPGWRSAISGRASVSDEDRMVAAPVEEVLDEGDQPFVGPVDVLEDDHEGPLLGEPLEEAPPGGEEVLAVGRAPLRETEEMEEPRLDPGALVASGT